MSLNEIRLRIKKLYEIFLSAPKQWKRPKQSDVLYYDASQFEVLSPYLSQYSVEVIAIRGEFVNIPCLLRSFFNSNFWKGKIVQSYVEAFIQICNPKIILTFIDNDVGFYSISKRFPEVKTIFVQNGARENWLDKYKANDNYHVDYMLLFTDKIGEYYRKFISGKIIIIGSLKNNQVKKSNVEDNSILFVSQHRINIGQKWTRGDGLPVSWGEFFDIEKRVLKFLDEWCHKQNKLLHILGCRDVECKDERKFYSHLLNKCDWEFIPKTEKYLSYSNLDLSKIVVSIDSTLAYESVGRGNRTACFTCRGELLDTIGRNFGWPAALSDNGPFWTNHVDEKQFMRIMDYLNTVNDDEWERTMQSYVSELVESDPGNEKLINLLDSLLH